MKYRGLWTNQIRGNCKYSYDYNLYTGNLCTLKKGILGKHTVSVLNHAKVVIYSEKSSNLEHKQISVLKFCHH